MNPDANLFKFIIVSSIPVMRKDASLIADTLWSIDTDCNSRIAKGLTLVCPIWELTNTNGAAPIDRIDVVDSIGLGDRGLDAIVRDCDVVEIPGNFDWSGSAPGRRTLRAGRRHGRLCILGISSNRARTTVMNAAGRPWPSRLRAAARAASIGLSQRHLARRCDAVRMVGRGLVPLVEAQAKVLRVETASWICEEDIRPVRDGQSAPVRIVMASRLEPMKGLSVGVEAVARAVEAGSDLALDIIGVGAEEGALRQAAEDREIARRTRFLGQLGYPGPFYAALRTADYVLLTNLNDEQLRVIFDAISQGAIPVCPASPACLELGLDPRVYYDPGSATALSAALQALIALPEGERKALREGLRALARSRTIQTIHEERHAWISPLLEARAGER